MKSFVKVFLFLLALVLLIECEKEENYHWIYEIADDDKFVFEEGDTLNYICSDGSADKFYVRRILLYNKTGHTDEGPGWCILCELGDTYSAECFEVSIESISDRWDKHLRLDSIYTPCYIIDFQASVTSNGMVRVESRIKKGCDKELNSGSQAFVALDFCSDMPDYLYLEDRVFNNTEYYGVFVYNPDYEDYEIYWNMKYGIIRFVGYSESDTLYWDLEGKL